MNGRGAECPRSEPELDNMARDATEDGGGRWPDPSASTDGDDSEQQPAGGKLSIGYDGRGRFADPTF